MMRKMTSIIRRNWSTILQQSSHTGFRGLGGGVGIHGLGGVDIRGLGGVGIRGLGGVGILGGGRDLVIFLIMLLLFYSLLEVVQICKLISYLPTMYV
jgi:hypothetical protein